VNDFVRFWLAMALCSASAAMAQDPDSDSEPPSRPGDIIVYGRALEQVGIASSGSEGTVGYADFEKRPIARVGELAENVPGLIATQHSGTGKANQYFLRGFNLDHGTDLSASVDGVPVNMRSHGHGQGYLDLNFLIPELVERIDYTKGPYHGDRGDFSSAGSMAFTLRRTLAAPFAEVQAGSFGYARGLIAGSTKVGNGDLLAAIEGTRTNGPWVRDENLEKANLLLSYTTGPWSVGLSGYTSRWTSTDQVPERAIESGLIPRRGFIDDDLGGRAGRIALTINRRTDNTQITAYMLASRLRLTSNFTYFLDDPVNGDEFRQVDRRGVFGGSVIHRLDAGAAKIRIGGDVRFDRIGKVGLYRSVDGAIASAVREDRVDQLSGGVFAEGEIAILPRLRLIAGLRADAMDFRVRSDTPVNSGRGSDAILTPKAALAWQAADGIELYANYGEGFHSNDVRGATITIDPASGDPADRVPVFARSRGGEIGVRVERGALTASLVAFRLDLASELVFVGDAGTTEPNDATRRHGIEATLFWKPASWLTLDGSAAFTRARFRGVPAGLRRIPGATPNVIGGGISANVTDAITTTLRVRHFGSAPLIEDGSQRSEATTLVNMGSYWDTGRFRIGAELLNLFNARDPDISYFYASRLPGEPADGVEDWHIHPVEPRQIRITARYSF
jgi:hypothetical protein